tara:strand:+ start:2451 stop:2636 length:186 start_codon:yes stop_codon:yes gene_type:complete
MSDYQNKRRFKKKQKKKEERRKKMLARRKAILEEKQVQRLIDKMNYESRERLRPAKKIEET